MKRTITVTALLLLLPGFQAALPGADYVTRIRNGYVNWTKGTITAKGKAVVEVEENGTPVDSWTGSATSLNKARREAYQAAREKAMESIMEAARHIRVDPERKLSDLLQEDKFTQKKIAETVSGAVTVKEFPGAFDTSECEAKLKMGDIIASLPFDFPSNDFPARDDTPIPTVYSGLIIDARGLGIEPMLFPSVYNEEGLEIYGRYYIDSAYACKKGLVSYCYNEDEAMKNRKAGRRPYYAVALKNLDGCPVLSDRDARKILSSRETINNLKKCNVIFILDRETKNKTAGNR